MRVNDACHHCITNNSSIIYLQSLQKKKRYNNKETQDSISVSQNTVENTALIHRLCFFSSFNYQSVVSGTDQCDQCHSVIEDREGEKTVSCHN